MSRFLLSVHTVDTTARASLTDEEMRVRSAQVEQLEAEMRANDILVMSARLDDASAAHVVRPSTRRVRVTDGPFVETKEHLGGFYIIEVPDPASAIDWASKVTVAIDTPIEVRALAGHRDG